MKRAQYILLAIIAALSLPAGLAAAKAHAPNAATARVDFSFSPPEWQTAICLPDDPHKSLVDKSGALLYHYKRGGREFGTQVRVVAANDAVWEKQELLAPRVPVVRTYHSAGGLSIVEEAFAVDAPARSDWILVHVTNTGKEPRELQPKLVVDTKLGLQLGDQRVFVNTDEVITTSLKMTGLTQSQEIQLASVIVPAGKTVEFSICYSPVGACISPPATIEQAVAYWQKVPLPYDRIAVPDAGIQAVIDSSIRNIWQAREIKNGLPAFQVGPTCYRALFVVDGAFLLETVAMLGAGDQARNGVAYLFTFQEPDGQIKVISRFYPTLAHTQQFHKENGICIWTCLRQAQLTQDKAWLASVWPQLTRVAEFIRQMRQRTLNNDSPLDDGLIPPGYADGGIGGVEYEYTNVYWNLIGLRAFIDGARWLGRSDEAAAWQKEYESFATAFRRAAARDMKTDPQGHPYLPIRMDGQDLPQRAQWGFCHAVYPGQLFGKDDPLVAGNLAMLRATERQGMVYGTGWAATGIWTYFASFYAHAWLWQGNGSKAADLLYAFANHASPLLVWREEQSLKGEKFKKVGDMPHNWASAEFVRLAVHLLAMDRGDELHLLEGLPPAWTKPDMATKLTGIATPFGELHMELKVAADGKTARLRVKPLRDVSCKKVVVHLSGWAARDPNAVIELDPREAHDRVIPLMAVSAATATEAISPQPAPWEKIRSVPMAGDLRVFWNVAGGDNATNYREAAAHGFEMVDLLNTYADYPGRQKENIRKTLDTNKTNPWQKPEFFERIVKRNIEQRGNQGAIFVHDIEFSFEEDIAKVWADPVVRAASKTTTREQFADAYLREWATWFTLPCQWAKERFPGSPIGIYGPQPFRRDYFGIAGKSAQQIDGTHHSDAELWQYIDPFVDYYIASIYVFYDKPDSIYYMAANVEENIERARRYGSKPLYAYEWLRYHSSNKKLAEQEVAPWLAEAMAVLPYFCGARGVVLWGSEPKRQGQYYHTLPVFMNSLGRVSDLSAKIAAAKLMPDEPAHVLWKAKRPLIRRMRVSADEWIILAVNPWQAEDAISTVEVPLEKRSTTVELRGRHSELFHVVGTNRQRLSVEN